MATKRFTKFGLKRVNNLADVPNERLALNNILDGLRGDKEQFISEDLDCVRGLFPYNITINDFTQIADSAVKSTSTTGEFDVFKPLVTIENRFDRAYFTVSDPFFYGGDGLTARYYDDAQITRVGGLFTEFSGVETYRDNFWEQGNFVYSDKLTTNNLSLFGGIEWSGLYKPTQSGPHSFRIRTDGFYTFEFNDTPLLLGTDWNDRTGSYTEYGRWTESTKVINLTTISGSVTVTLTNISDLKYIMTGMSLSSGFDTDIVIENIDESAGTFRMSDAATSSLTNQNVTLTKEPGTEGIITFSVGELEKFKAYPIRIRYFIDENSIPPSTTISKTFDIQDISPNQNDNNLRYNHLYDEIYFDGYISGDFKSYIDNSISIGGTEVGGSGTIGSSGSVDEYNDVNTLSTISSSYEPPKVINDIKVTKTNASIKSGSTTVLLTNDTDNVAIGNYVFGPGIPDQTRIIEVVFQSSIILDKIATATASGQTITVINHNGLVAHGLYDSQSGGTINKTGSNDMFIFNEDRVRPGQIIITDGGGYNGSNWQRIISYTAATNEILTTQSGSSSGSNSFYVYYDSALVDESLDAYCTGVIAHRIVPPTGTGDYTYSTGTTQITLDDTTGLSNGMYAHFVPKIPFTTGTVSGKTIYNSSTTISSSGNVITLSSGLIDTISYTDSVITQITFSSSPANKEICFKPTDTAPPFNATNDGLNTPKNIKMVQSDNTTPNTSAQLTYSDLELIIPSADVATVNTNTDSVSFTLPILDADNNPFKILLGS